MKHSAGQLAFSMVVVVTFIVFMQYNEWKITDVSVAHIEE